jgi:hypothetical protein
LKWWERNAEGRDLQELRTLLVLYL